MARGKKGRRKAKHRRFVDIGEEAPGGANTHCPFVVIFAGPVLQQLARYLTISDAAILRRVCKALYHAGMNPMSYASSIPLHRSHCQVMATAGQDVQEVVMRHDYRYSSRSVLELKARLAPSVRRIVLTGGDENFFNTFIAACTNLRDMHVDVVAYPGRFIVPRMLATHLSVNAWPHLRTLSIANHVQGWQDFTALVRAVCDALPSLPSLRHLALRKSSKQYSYSPPVTPPWCPPLLNALHTGALENLHSLALCIPLTCHSHTDVCELFTQGLNHVSLPNLRAFEIALSDAPRRDQVDQWKHACTSLWEDLAPASWLECVKIRDEAALLWPALVSTLAKRPYMQLKELAVTSSYVTSRYMGGWSGVVGSEELVVALESGHMPSLRSLTIKQKGETPAEAVQPLLTALQQHATGLTKLDLSLGLLPEAVRGVMAATVSWGPSLQSLSLAGIRALPANGMMVDVAALKPLTCLSLASCPLTAAAAAPALAAQFAASEALHLELSSLHVVLKRMDQGASVVEELCAALKSTTVLPPLRIVSLDIACSNPTKDHRSEYRRLKAVAMGAFESARLERGASSKMWTCAVFECGRKEIWRDFDITLSPDDP